MHREKSIRGIAASLLLALLPASALSAQDAISAEEAAAAVRSAFVYTSADLAEGTGRTAPGQTIAVDLALLEEDPAQLRVELPGGAVYVALRSASWTEEGGRRYWGGELHSAGALEKEAEGMLTLSVEGGLVAGSLRAGGASFEILPLADGRQQLVPSATRVQGAGAGAHCEAIPSAAAVEAEPVALLDSTTKYPPSVVDVLVVFPQSLAANATQQAQTRARILSWFGDANLALANSGQNHRYRAVHVGPLTGAQPPAAANSSESTAILGYYWLTAGQPEVTALRDSLQADLVALFVPQDANLNCGAAQIGNPSTDEYASIDLGCASGEYLVAHELGHLLGMRHTADESGSPPPPSPYAYAFGYDDNNQLTVGGQRAATVMACNGNNNGAPNATLTGIQCNRIPYFSNPTIPAGGVAIGNAAADNAEVARRQMYLTSLRRPALSTGNLPPRITLLRPQGTRAQSGQQITLSARAVDTEDGNLDASIQWTSNRRGYLGTGSFLRVYSSLLGYETITASVVDSGGLSYSQSKTLYFETLVTTEGAIWHDPNFPGRFLTFNKNINNDWIAVWMAYEGSSPVWYSSAVQPVASNGSFASQLQRYTRNVSTGQQTATTFGNLTISVETEKQIRLQVTPFSGTPVDLLLEPYTQVSGAGAFWSLVGGQVDPGWLIFRGPTTFGPTGQETRMVVTFDGPNPVWVFGLGSRTGLPSQPFGLFMYRPTPATMTSNYQVPNSSNIGNLVFSDYATVWTSLYFPSGYNWIRYEQAVDGFTVR